MNFKTYDIYTDASINTDLKVSCSGSIVVDRTMDKIVSENYLIKQQATNNMGEAIGIFMGVRDAIGLLWTSPEPFIVNIFSDSRISLFGAREWISSWIMRQTEEGDLIGSVGVIANQEWFSSIYNDILSSGVKVKFFHQKGHVNTHFTRDVYKAEKLFKLSNGVSSNMAGTDQYTLARYNNMVDEHSRTNLNSYLSGGDLNMVPNTMMIGEQAVKFNCNPDLINKYKDQTKGGLNYPINSNFGGM